MKVVFTDQTDFKVKAECRSISGKRLKFLTIKVGICSEINIFKNRKVSILNQTFVFLNRNVLRNPHHRKQLILIKDVFFSTFSLRSPVVTESMS